MSLIDDCIVILLILIAVWQMIEKLSKEKCESTGFVFSLLAVYHFSFSVLFFLYPEPLDSNYYYNLGIAMEADNLISLPTKSTGAMAMLSYWLCNSITHLYQLTANFIFATISLFGLFLIFLMLPELKTNSKFSKGIQVLIFFPFFFPSIHYWSTSVSKEAIMIGGLSAIVYMVYKFRRKNILLLPMVIASLFVRPHIVILFLAGGFVTWFCLVKLPCKLKLGISTLTIIIGLMAINYFMSTHGNKSLSFQSFNKMISQWEQSIGYSDTNSANVSLKDMIFPFKFCTFWFRPFFENLTVKILVGSIENLMLIIAIISLCTKRFLKFASSVNLVVKMSIGGALGVSLFMCLVSSNFGYAMRQKSTILPFVCLLVVSYWINTVITNKDEISTA